MPSGAGFLPEPLLAATLAKLKALAGECGFTAAGELKADTLRTLPEVRGACAADKCKSYGKNWSCPPACGSLGDCERRFRQYRAGLIVQSTGNIEDSFDYDEMRRLGGEHGRRLRDFQEKTAPLFAGEALSDSAARPWLLLGSGACKVCEVCTCPDSPCRFPGRMIISMEAMGLLVSEVCRANNIPYYYGPGTLTYVGCILF
jgi:predicted metal-binding protein